MSDFSKVPHVPGAVLVAKAKLHSRVQEAQYGAEARPEEVRSERLNFGFVYEQEGPNKKWSEATPSGGIDMLVSSKGAIGAAKLGQSYLVYFVPCDADV